MCNCCDKSQCLVHLSVISVQCSDTSSVPAFELPDIVSSHYVDCPLTFNNFFVIFSIITLNIFLFIMISVYYPSVITLCRLPDLACLDPGTTHLGVVTIIVFNQIFNQNYNHQCRIIIIIITRSELAFGRVCLQTLGRITKVTNF